MLFILQEISKHLDNIVEEGKGNMLSSHEREEVYKINPLVVHVWIFWIFPRTKIDTSLIFSYI